MRCGARNYRTRFRAPTSGNPRVGSAWSCGRRKMKDVVSPSYDRAPSERLRQLLSRDGFLSPLLAKRTVAGVDLEVHLRPADEVDLYCGLTCLVKGGRSQGGPVWIESHGRYAGQPCASGLFRPGRTKEVNRGNYRRDEWAVGEPGFARALDTFLGGCRGRSEANEGGGGSGPGGRGSASRGSYSTRRRPWRIRRSRNVGAICRIVR